MSFPQSVKINSMANSCSNLRAISSFGVGANVFIDGVDGIEQEVRIDSALASSAPVCVSLPTVCFQNSMPIFLQTHPDTRRNHFIGDGIIFAALMCLPQGDRT